MEHENHNKTLIHLLKPGLLQVIFFSLVCAILLSLRGIHVEHPAVENCYTTVNYQTQYGYPFSYYSKSGSGDRFSVPSLLFNLLLLFFLTYFVATLFKVVYHYMRHGGNRQRLISLSILVNIIAIGFISLNIFGETLLLNAVKRQDFYTTSALLVLGVNANSQDSNRNRSVLQAAVLTSNVDVSRILMTFGADPKLMNRHGQIAMHTAARHNVQAIIKLFAKNKQTLNARDSKGRTPLHYACNKAAAQLLVKLGASPKIKDYKQKLPGDMASDKQLSEYFASIGATQKGGSSAPGSSALSANTPPSHAPKVTLGTPPPTANKKISAKDSAALNKLDDAGQTILHKLVKSNAEMEVVIPVVKAGANVDLPDKKGYSALHYAIMNCNVPLGKLLVQQSQQVKQARTSKKLKEPLKSIIKKHPDCWKRIVIAQARNPVKIKTGGNNTKTSSTALTNIKIPEKSILCKTSIAGNLHRKGKRYEIAKDSSGTIKAYSGSQGFLYGHCPQAGFFHILLQTSDGKQKVITNLISDGKEDSPLINGRKDSALVSFDMPAGQARLYWFFSKSKIASLQRAMNDGSLLNITSNNVNVVSIP